MKAEGWRFTEVLHGEDQDRQPRERLVLPGVHGRVMIDLTAFWKAELFRPNVLDQKAKNPRARFNELRTRLAAKKLIGTRDDLIWLAGSHPQGVQ